MVSNAAFENAAIATVIYWQKAHAYDALFSIPVILSMGYRAACAAV